MPLPPSPAKTSARAFQRKVSELRREPDRAGAAEVRSGSPVADLDAFAASLGVDVSALAPLLGVSARTLQRRRQEGRLGPLESDRLWRLRDVQRSAVEAFDGREAEARAWLTSPKRAFGGDSPLAHLDTEPGTQAVRQMLAAMEHTMPV